MPALAALPCPLPAIYGADDLLGPVERTADLILAVNRDHEIVVLPAALGYPELVVTWLRRRCHRAAST